MVLLLQLVAMLPRVKLFLAFGEMKCKVQLYVAGKGFHEIVASSW